MKHKIGVILLGFILAMAFAVSVNAQTVIKEDATKYSGNIYIIGSSKFDSNIVVNGTMIGVAGARESMIQYNVYQNYEFKPEDLKIYYYSGLSNKWSLLPQTSKDEFRPLTENETKELTENLNIFYVNSDEKVMEIPYDGTVDSIFSPDNNVIFENGVFKVPVLTRYFEFSSNDVINYVETNVIESVLNGEDIAENVEIIPEWAAFEANGKYYDVDSVDEMLASADELNIKLVNFADLKTGMLIDKKVTLDLNYNNISISQDTAGEGVFHVVEGGNLTINGEGIVDGVGKNKWNIVVWADGGDVTINGGTYTNTEIEVLPEDTDSDHFDVIYAKQDSKVVINGGYFEGKTPAWLLNLHDGSRDKASITVNGGTFVGLNPADSKAEGDNTNFVAPGYKVTCYDEFYYVEPVMEGDIVLVNGIAWSSLPEAVANAPEGARITLLEDIDLETAVEVSKKLTIDLNWCNLTVTQDTEGYGVFHVVEGGDLTINGEGVVDGAGKNKWNIVVFADGGDVTINGGTYTNANLTILEEDTDSDHFDVIYAKGNGSVVINGGRFEGKTPAWLLNLHDGSRDTASITVNGGTFVGLNPAESLAEGEGTNFVSSDCEVTTEVENEYKVIKKAN